MVRGVESRKFVEKSPRFSWARRRRQGQGFTLVELLVVIAIIALLASLLVPTLKSAQESARSAMCQSNLRQIAAAFSLYVADNEGYLPPYTHIFSDSKGATVVGPEGRVRYTTYRRYLLVENWFKSGPYTDHPRSGGGFLAEYLGTSEASQRREPGTHGILGCPSVPPGPNLEEGTVNGVSFTHFTYRDTSLALNYKGVTQQGSSHYHGKSSMIPLSIIGMPAQLVFMTEGNMHTPYVIEPGRGRLEDHTISIPDPRHNGRYNALFVDGHVISTTWEENFTREHYVR